MLLSTPITVSLDELIELGRAVDLGQDSHRPTEDEVDEKILMNSLSSAVSNLPAPDLSLVSSIYYGGTKKSEYAQKHRVSPAAITKKLHRIHKQLRIALERTLSVAA